MEILWLPTNDVYVIRNREEEVLIPVVPEIIKAILLDEKLIIITPMDGLLN
jgi:ribosomal 30S subunit maturation factor RimM